MQFLLSLGSIILGVWLLFLLLRKRKERLDFFTDKKQHKKTEIINESIIDIKALANVPIHRRIYVYLYSSVLPLGKKVVLKVFIYYFSWLCLASFLSVRILHLDIIVGLILFLFVATIIGLMLLHRMARHHFNVGFPEALNMLSSAITAGDSLMHAIIYVGKKLDNDVGQEFKRMGERLQIGESPDDVLKRACRRFPYSEFVFFTITLRANINRGGQLRDIIQRLNRVMFESRALEKKKKALTAEARMSSKIVAIIPFGVIIMLRFLSPENFDFLFTNSHGQLLLYYVIVSEAIGMAIMYAFMRGIR